MKKYTFVKYDPYFNKLEIKIMNNATQEWEPLAENSELLSFENQEIMFSNCVEDIVRIIDNGQNSESEGLEIQFIGLDSDYKLLERAVKNVNTISEQRGDLYSKHIGRYQTADKVLDIIRNCYDKIADEFYDYLPGQAKYEDYDSVIGDSIERFNTTVSNEIPICIIGNYSVGKSAFINSFIGEEVLPSAENASTAKNAKLISSNQYAIRFQYNIDSFSNTIECLIKKSKLSVSCKNSDLDTKKITSCLKAVIKDDHKYEPYIIHDILDYFNQSEKDEFLEKIGWNVEIEVPFTNSVLSKLDSKIVFYDTPGSNNSTVNQKEHREALIKLMSEQTNGLPILVCSRDSAVANDNLDIVNALDQNNDNFTLPSCIIVFSKSDKLSIKDLQEPIPIRLRSWHGKTTIMFASPIGAIGERKKDKKLWLDGSYEEHYEAWRERTESKKRAVSLPDYNLIPCERDDLLDAHVFSTSRLYATGIPSIECEIAYFIEHYAKYKKCNRGNRDLMEALNVVRKELNIQENNYKNAKLEAEHKKQNQRNILINQLNSIQMVDIKQLSMFLRNHFNPKVNIYCLNLTNTAKQIYEQIKNEPMDSLEEHFDALLREDCQEKLFDACYLGEDGIEEQIIKNTKDVANDYAEKLQTFVEKNNTHFSVTGKESLKKALSSTTMPIIQSQKGVLANILDIPERINLFKFKTRKKIMGMIKMDDEKGVNKWLESKVQHFEKELKGGTILIPQGLFEKQAIEMPLKYYSDQYIKWGNDYRSFIASKLDDDNTILSGMEDEILKLDDTVNYFSTRVNKLTDVETEIKHVLDYQEI